MIDVPTLLGCTAAFFAVVAGLFYFFWFKDGRIPSQFWFGLPFVMGLCSAVLMVKPALLPGFWGIRLGAWFILLAHAAGWQAIRALYERPILPLAALGPPLIWLGFSATFIEDHALFALSSSIRAAIYALFNGLAAYELWRGRDEDLTSRSALFWLFVGFAAFALLRVPFTAYLPAPLGVTPTQGWSVAVYNFFVVVQVLLASALILSMSRERVSLSNYNLALIDPLTGVFNRRAFDISAKEWAHPPFSVALLLFDLDWFKSINDRFGHDVGDEVIVVAARTAEELLRKSDRIFRIGGEEFVCLLPETTTKDAVTIAERLRLAFQAAAKNVAEIATNATISIGIAASPDGSVSIAELMVEADKALYRAKGAGRNQTALAGAEGSGRDKMAARS